MSSAAPEGPRPVRFGIMGCATIARHAARPRRHRHRRRQPLRGQGAPLRRGHRPPRQHAPPRLLRGPPRRPGRRSRLPPAPHQPPREVGHRRRRAGHARAPREAHRALRRRPRRHPRRLRGQRRPVHGLHHVDAPPRTAKMRELVADQGTISDVRVINSVFSFRGNEDFLHNDIRVKPDLDALGALGDTGWYCIRAILWAVDYELPKNVIALRDPVKNQAGVLLACGATFYWADGKIATFNCSFLINLTMDITVVDTNGTLHVTDFVIPYEEKSAPFSVDSKSNFAELHIGWDPQPSKHVVTTDLPQEALMVQEFSRLVQSIRDAGGKPEGQWPSITRKTQIVMDAVKTSIDNGFEAVDVAS